MSRRNGDDCSGEQRSTLEVSVHAFGEQFAAWCAEFVRDDAGRQRNPSGIGGVTLHRFTSRYAVPVGRSTAA